MGTNCCDAGVPGEAVTGRNDTSPEGSWVTPPMIAGGNAPRSPQAFAAEPIFGVPGRSDFERHFRRDEFGDNLPRVEQINKLRGDNLFTTLRNQGDFFTPLRMDFGTQS